jgi:hypothetical protein
VGHKLEKMYTFSLIYAPPPPSYMRVGVGHKLEKMYMRVGVGHKLEKMYIHFL